MTDLPTARLSYLKARSIHPNSIPGVACIRGDYDTAQGFVEHMKGMVK